MLCGCYLPFSPSCVVPSLGLSAEGENTAPEKGFLNRCGGVYL